MNEYRLRLLKSTKGKQFRSALPKSDHNLISSAFLIEFGNSRIVLGGDVEEDGWQDVLKTRPVSSLSAHAVKVPHHGSKNGYCPTLWDQFSIDRKPVAVLTPYTPKSLPQKIALDHIRSRSKAIHSAATVRHPPDSFPPRPIHSLLAFGPLCSRKQKPNGVTERVLVVTVGLPSMIAAGVRSSTSETRLASLE